MNNFYMMTTADELEWPIAVGRSIKELSINSGKSTRILYNKLHSQKRGAKVRGYKIEFVEIEEYMGE